MKSPGCHVGSRGSRLSLISLLLLCTSSLIVLALFLDRFPFFPPHGDKMAASTSQLPSLRSQFKEMPSFHATLLYIVFKFLFKHLFMSGFLFLSNYNLSSSKPEYLSCLPLLLVLKIARGPV